MEGLSQNNESRELKRRKSVSKQGDHVDTSQPMYKTNDSQSYIHSLFFNFRDFRKIFDSFYKNLTLTRTWCNIMETIQVIVIVKPQQLAIIKTKFKEFNIFLQIETHRKTQFKILTITILTVRKLLGIHVSGLTISQLIQTSLRRLDNVAINPNVNPHSNISNIFLQFDQLQTVMIF